MGYVDLRSLGKQVTQLYTLVAGLATQNQNTQAAISLGLLVFNTRNDVINYQRDVMVAGRFLNVIVLADEGFSENPGVQTELTISKTTIKVHAYV